MTAPSTTVLATRGIGAIEFLRDLLPEAALAGLGVLTWLGSVVLLAPLALLVYWFHSREDGAFALAAVLGGFAVTVVLKAGFGLARPPDSLWLVAAAGFGFPSGHAIASTVGWGALATRIGRGPAWGRLAVVAAIVAIVALSRVALGVHFAVDVLAGIAVGVVYLGLLLWLGTPDRAFGAATLGGLLATAATGGADDALLVLGAAAGGWLAWTRLTGAGGPWGPEGVLPAVVGTVAFGVPVLVGHLGRLPAPIDVALGAVALAGLVGLPALVDRLRRGPPGARAG